MDLLFLIDMIALRATDMFPEYLLLRPVVQKPAGGSGRFAQWMAGHPWPARGHSDG